MGLDYIRAQTGKPWRKRWNGGLDRLKAPTLLDLTMSEAARTVTAELNAGSRIRAGDTLIVQSVPDGLNRQRRPARDRAGGKPLARADHRHPRRRRLCRRRAPARRAVRRHRGDQREMNRRPSHEPSRHFPQPQRLWDDATRQAPSLGCPTCLERDRCGGIHTDAGVLDCRDLCSCQDRTKCDMVCRFNPRLFVARMREVGGLGFEAAPRAAANGVPRTSGDRSLRRSPLWARGDT